MKVTIPYRFEPRFYQLPFLQAMDSGVKRACLVWHRKSGKTKTLINFACKKMFQRVGAIYHCFPEYGQGRKIVWDGIDDDGFKTTEHIPKSARANINNTEMKITLKNNSIYQVIGADNYDSLVGPNPVGLILDEWAVSDRYKQAWDYFRPILASNGGWAVFVYTPRGRNHGWDTYQMALRNPEWFCQLLTVEDTKAITVEAIDLERKSGMSESMIQQEFYCSFLASVEDVLIPFNLISEALRRETVPIVGATRIAGLDVARFGDDRNALIVRQAGQIIMADTWSGMDTVYTAGKVVDLFRSKLFDIVAIDTIGLGAGVFDMVRNAEVPCVPVVVSERSSQEGRFKALRDELWWRVREWFMEGGCVISEGLGKTVRDSLVADIQDVRYSFSPKGLIQVERKEEMKERLGWSPDLGDALCCTFTPGINLKASSWQRLPAETRMVQEMEQDYNPLRWGLS